MDKYKDLTKDIPWNSTGKETVLSKAGYSLIPVGVYPFELPPFDKEKPQVKTSRDLDMEQFLMNIVGTAIQAGTGKLITCCHVIEAVLQRKAQGYILARLRRGGAVVYTPYPIKNALKYIDPRN